MTCPFDLTHYRELLEAAQAGGYRFALFDHDPEPGDLFLRHDVDLSLEAAVELAEVEAGAGARATYFLMSRSVFYNLRSAAGDRAVERLLALGHALGHHAVYPHIDVDERFAKVLAWHNPDPEFMRLAVEEFANVMSGTWFDPDRYRSDSNQHWRSGCPHDDLRAGAFEWLQLLTHPEIWVYEGATMRESMHGFLDADREVRLAHLAEDRIDLS